MAKSTATTVEQYLGELPEERRVVMAAVRDLVRRHLPAGYEEAMNWGMICWQVPLSRYPKTPNRHPLLYLGLATRKHGYTLHAMTAYAEGEAWLRDQFERAGRKLDMGKACIHFRRLEDLPLDVIAELATRTSVEQLIALVEESRARRP